jgi:hypothetical protein
MTTPGRVDRDATGVTATSGWEGGTGTGATGSGFAAASDGCGATAAYVGVREHPEIASTSGAIQRQL